MKPSVLLPPAACLAFLTVAHAQPAEPRPPELDPWVAVASGGPTGLLTVGAMPGVTSDSRAVSALSREWFDRTGGVTVGEWLHALPGARQQARFGNLTTPTIRGDAAETYINGQRRSAILFGIQPTLNGVEAVTALRGAGTVVMGPGLYSGGAINYQTRRPSLEGDSGSAALMVGGWYPGKMSHRAMRWSLHQDQVLRPGRLGLLVSYEGQDDETRLGDRGGRADYHELAGSLDWRPGDEWEVTLHLAGGWQAMPQLLGINRPNQELVDDRTYFRGTPPDIGGPFIAPWYVPDAGTARVGHDDGLFSQGDFSNAAWGLGQLIVSRDRGDGSGWVNRLLVEGVDRSRGHAFAYAEWVEQLTIEDRFEWSMRHGDGARSLLGGAVRFEARESYVNYFNEYGFNFDIMAGDRFSLQEDFPATWFPGLPGPEGRPFFGAAQGSPETTDSELWQISGFLEHARSLGDRLHFTGGVRGDLFLAAARDPLPPPGGPVWDDAHDDVAVSFHVGLDGPAGEGWRWRVSRSRTYAVNGSVAGGGILLFNGEIDPEDFRNRSDLWEIGLSQASADGRWSADLTGFHQARTRTEFRGGRSDLRARGFEATARWSLSERFGAELGVDFLDAAYLGAVPFQLGGASLFDLYAEGGGPGGAGTGRGFEPFPGARQVDRGDYRVPGISRWAVRASWHAETDGGWGLDLRMRWQSEQPGNLHREYTIPDQFNADLTLYRQWDRWFVALDFLNLTDEVNWVHNGDAFMNNQLITLADPRAVRLRLRWRW